MHKKEWIALLWMLAFALFNPLTAIAADVTTGDAKARQTPKKEAAADLPHFTGAVISVADGNTITLLSRDKQQVKIRLYGIDCLERNRLFGARAKQAASDAVLGKSVTVLPINTDNDGRMVAVVLMPGDKSLNEHLVRNGMALVNPQLCTQKEICEPLRKLEQAARSQRRGLWADKDPVPSQHGGGGLTFSPVITSTDRR